MSTSNPTVSVIIPTYNQAEYLYQAIKSVLDQTYLNFEIVVINNNSKDNTIEVVNAFQDQRIRLVNFCNGDIIAASRNKGINLARGGLIAFLDSDDYWYPSKLEACVARIEKNDILCHGELWIKGEQPYKKVVYGPKERARYLSLLLNRNCISTSATVVRKSILVDVGGFNESRDVITAEDYDLWLRIAKQGGRFDFIEDTLGVYRLHESNASGNIFKSLKACAAVLDAHFSLIQSKTISVNFKMYRRKSLLYLSALCRYCYSIL